MQKFYKSSCKRSIPHVKYCTNNDISRYIPAELEKKFEMITKSDIPNEIRRIVSLTIIGSWKQLNETDRVCITKGTVFLLQNDFIEAADTILRNIIGNENPFNQQIDTQILNYLVSPIGNQFPNLLSNLRRAKNFK